MTTMNGRPADERLVFLDGWRGLAVIAVMVGHFFPVPGIDMGSFGVELFFVLSGRLMAEILFVRRQDARQFLWRRFSRVYPALLVFVLCVSVPAMMSVEWLNTKQPLARLPDIAAALTFTMNYMDHFATRGLAFGHTWSLAVEEHSYLVLLALALWIRRNTRMALGFMAAATVLCVTNGIISSVWFGQGEEAAYWRTDVRIASILMSATIYLAIREFELQRFMHPALTVLAAILAVALFADGMPNFVRYGAVTLLLAWSINALDFAPRPIQAVLSVRPLVAAGLISYSLYLWQQPFYAAAGSLRAKGMIYVVALAVAAVCCAIGSYYLVERPARRALNAMTLRSRRQGASAPAGTVEWFVAVPPAR